MISICRQYGEILDKIYLWSQKYTALRRRGQKIELQSTTFVKSSNFFMFIRQLNHVNECNVSERIDRSIDRPLEAIIAIIECKRILHTSVMRKILYR